MFALVRQCSWLHRSPFRNCSHETLPFVEAAAKAKLAGSIETQPGHRLTALTAFRIIDVPIIAARNKDVRREWVVFCFHCRKLRLDITYRRSESLQWVLKACRTHAVQSNISAAERQAHCGGANRRFQLPERSQLFIRANNQTLSVIAVSGSNRSPNGKS
jgi:hypothetical protein